MLSALAERAPAGVDGEALGRAFYEVCVAEVQALKPGNVSFHAGGHGMRADDFVASARAAAPALCLPGLGCGARVLAAVEATRQVVACNTNLGIVLLCAPLACAAQATRPQAPLRARLEAVLQGLTVADAVLAYRAIRLANPGGLGYSARHDVAQEPEVSLLEAMREAAGRDRVAAQYAGGYADVFDAGLPLYRQAVARRGAGEWATVELYLAYLARFPDSHVARKHGDAVARQVSAAARPLAGRLAACPDAAAMAPELLEWDALLKERGINPGTSADLTVATLFAARIEDMLSSPAPLVAARDDAVSGVLPTVSSTKLA